MNNYITEKALWQAINTNKHQFCIELYNYILSLRCKFKVIYVSYERLAARFGVTVKTIGRWMTKLKELYLISDKKRWLKTSLYQINPMVLKYSMKYRQIFPALKHFIENALEGVYSSNVLHNYNDSYNSNQEEPTQGLKSSVFSSSQDFLKSLKPTFIENWYFQAQVGCDFAVGSEDVKKLTEEEADEIFGGRKLTIPELVEWYNENKKSENNEANNESSICE